MSFQRIIVTPIPQLQPRVSLALPKRQFAYGSHFTTPIPSHSNPVKFGSGNAITQWLGGLLMGSIDSENISPWAKRMYIQKYQKETGFPNLALISQKIEQHARDVILQASRDTGVPVIWSGYVIHSSVAKHRALPGSDLDEWLLLIRGNEEDKQRFLKKASSLINPQLMRVDDPHNSIHCYLESEVNATRGQTMKEYYNSGAQSDEAFHRRGEIIKLIEYLRDARTLVDHRTRSEDWIKHSDIYQNCFIYRDADLKLATSCESRPKFAFREYLTDSFPNLSLDEQFLIIRLFDAIADPSIMDQFSNGASRHHYQEVIRSLVSKRILEWDTTHQHIFPFYMDSHAFEGARIDFAPILSQ